MRLAAIFPGQGSQVVGMGSDVAVHSSKAGELFKRAAATLGYDLLDLQRRGPEERLRETQFSQPAIFTTNLALYYAAEVPAPIVSAGHSFGEFCSLTIAGSLSFEEALRIVDARGKAMQYAAEVAPGGMTAILGLEPSQIRELVAQAQRETGERVQLANFNSPTQIVISGDLNAVNAAAQAALAAGAKRVVPLNVSGAWHSALMEPAVVPFSAAVDSGHFQLPEFDVISNVDAQRYENIETIKTNLVRSITQEVRWHDTALAVLAYNPDAVVEFGATPVLGPLMRRLPEAPNVINVSDRAGIEKLQTKIREHVA